MGLHSAGDKGEEALINCQDPRNLFLEEVEKASRKKSIMISSPMNGTSHGKNEDCQKEWNGDVPWLYKRGKTER